MPYTPHNPYIPGDPYSYDLKWLVSQVKAHRAILETLDERIRKIVTAELDQHDPVYYQTAQELIDSAQKAPSIAYIEGYYAAGDGGANLYYVTDDYNDVLAADYYITLSGANRWAIPVILTPYVTPEMFGAKGDGAADDTAAVAAAFNYPVIYAFKTYACRNMTYSGDFIHSLYGRNTGKFILIEDDANIFQINGSSGSFVIDGVEFDGNHMGMASPGGGLIQANDIDLTLKSCYIHDFDGTSASNAVSGTGQTILIAEDSRFISCSSGPYFLSKKMNVVRNCYIENCLAGVQLSSTKHAVIDGNVFYDNQGDITAMTTYQADINDITIINNHFIETRGYNEYTGSITSYVNKPLTTTKIDMVIADNTFTDIKCAAVALGSTVIPAGYIDTISSVNIHDNIVDITAITGDTTTGAFVIMNASNVHVNNNNVKCSGDKNIRAVYFRGKQFTGEMRFNYFLGNFRDFIVNSGTAADLNIELDLEHNIVEAVIEWLLYISTSTITANSYIRVFNAPGEIEYSAADYITSTFYGHTQVEYSKAGTYTRYLITANDKGAGMILHMGSSNHFYYYDQASSAYRELTTQAV